MNKSKQFFLKICALGLSVSLLAGCSGGASSAPASGASEAKDSKPQVLTVIKNTDLNSMNPQLATDGLSFEVLGSTMEGLYSMDKDGQAIPALAEKSVVSPDGLNITFTLRPAKWSNGDPVTAQDFVYGWQKLIDPKNAAEYAYMLDVAGVKNAQEIMDGKMTPDQLGVTAKDDQTLEVQLSRPIPFFNKLMTFPPYFPNNKKFVEEQGDQYALTPEACLANGPFKLTQWYPGSSWHLSKNDNYWDKDKVQLSEIVFKVVQDPQSAVLEYESGGSDYVALSGDLVEKYKDKPGYENTLGSYVWFVLLNHKTGEKASVLGNSNLGLAIANAVNREQVAKDVLKDGSIAALGFVPRKLASSPSGKDFRDDAPSYFQEGKDAAKTYWEKAQNELGKKELRIELLFEDSTESKRVAEFMKAQLETALPGLTIDLKSQPKKTRLQLMQKSEYEMILTRWGPDYADPMTYLDLYLTGASYNYCGFVSPKYDELVNLARSGSQAPEERWKTMIEAEGVLLKDATGPIPIYQTGAALLWNPKVKGVINNAVGIPFTYKDAFIEP